MRFSVLVTGNFLEPSRSLFQGDAHRLLLAFNTHSAHQAGYYGAGNEPSFQTPIGYHYADQPARSVDRVRDVVFSNFDISTLDGFYPIIHHRLTLP
jgi:putative alpha-1,2-mannosidase